MDEAPLWFNEAMVRMHAALRVHFSLVTPKLSAAIWKFRRARRKIFRRRKNVKFGACD